MNCPNNKEQKSGMMASQKEETKASQTDMNFVAVNETVKNWTCKNFVS